MAYNQKFTVTKEDILKDFERYYNIQQRINAGEDLYPGEQDDLRLFRLRYRFLKVDRKHLI